ncbi:MULTISPECIES: homocysteine S-methyltransferase family protein [Roseobacteraceae]|uniref:Homocysteine S-methyltransferase n=1 Tax=Pseudosulfitobacter pseudonitzschiae TaxID=1402135 RepID=A0A221K3Y9_9RHOB|nr:MULTISPECIES: homocysteine S-methyltransferase family protein [Roseobacteraceae]ASM73722.1 homocysteine S-methyltransferase [Pseudosulfitobacter pseudonitzschiae]
MTQITLLDGGMGQELIHRAGDRPTPLWSTQVMIDHPGMVAEVHRDFTAAGATIATTNTYAIHRDRLVGTDMDDQFNTLIDRALTEARDSNAPRLAGAIGPLVASYRPDLHPDPDTAIPLYAEVAGLLAPTCDLLICETVASLDHARSVLVGASQAGKPVWLALTVDDRDGTKLRSGEPVQDILPIASGKAAAILINCSAPEAIPAALAILSQGALPFGAYANGFQRITEEFLQTRPTVADLQVRHDLTPATYADHVMAWIDAGATIVGGCCEVGPAHIAEIARRLIAAGHTLAKP